jgi:desulfoferrodoxin (superoxide reductase-like protein)
MLKIIVIPICLLFAACNTDDARTKRPEIPKYHTQEAVGIWDNEVDSHMPVITGLGNKKIEVRINFTPTIDPPHYIETIVLMKGKEKQIEAKKFTLSKEWPVAVFTVPTYEDDYWVVAKCNLHDMWKADVKLSDIKGEK